MGTGGPADTLRLSDDSDDRVVFHERRENRTRGRFRALAYGLCIVGLYTLPITIIIVITNLFGQGTVTADIFNWLATHWIPNVIFFLVFMVFAASFFGAFEITMPSRLVNRSDEPGGPGRPDRYLFHGADARAGLVLVHGPRSWVPY